MQAEFESMVVVKNLRKRRNKIVLFVVMFFSAVPITAYYLAGESGFIAVGMLALIVPALLIIPASKICCPYCSHNLIQKFTENGTVWYSPTVPNICPACNSDLNKPYDASLVEGAMAARKRPKYWAH